MKRHPFVAAIQSVTVPAKESLQTQSVNKMPIVTARQPIHPIFNPILQSSTLPIFPSSPGTDYESLMEPTLFEQFTNFWSYDEQKSEVEHSELPSG